MFIVDGLDITQTKFRSQAGAFPSATETRSIRIGGGTFEEPTPGPDRNARGQ